MSEPVRIAFERRVVTLSLDQVLPTRTLAREIRTGSRYQRIKASIAEVGIIEPMLIARLPGQADRFVLLDGHVRLEVLRGRGDTEGQFLIADDDEAYTHNKRVNRPATIQEHFMLLRAIERGAPKDKLARALHLKPQDLERRRALLDGICPDVVELLKDRVVTQQVFVSLRKMKPLRQIEVTNFMLISNSVTAGYAKALLVSTPDEQLVNPRKTKAPSGVSPEQLARLEREMETLQRDMKQIEDNYGDDVLNLTVARGFVGKLIGNPAIVRYLERHYPELLEEFRNIVSATGLDLNGGLTP